MKNLRYASGELSDIYSFHSAKIRNSALVKGIRFYEIAIHKFLGNSVIKRLEGINSEVMKRYVPALSPIPLSVAESGWIFPD